MTQREKRLAMLVGVILAVVSVGFVSWSLYGAFNRRAIQLEAAEKKREDNSFKIQLGNRADRSLRQYASLALPENPDVARSIYQDWLMKVVGEIGLAGRRVTAQTIRPRGDVYTVHPFHVSGDGNVQQLTDLLHAISSANVLHRIQSLTVQPQKDKKEMTITLVVEALSMPGVPTDRPPLKSDPAAIVNGHDREYYRSKIVGRNLFGPENKPPKLGGDETLVAYRGQRFEYAPQGEDPDKLDKVNYEADLSKLPGAKMNNDRLEWTPKSNGDYQITIIARDNGFPAREMKRDFKISVKDPPKAEPPKRAFDVAKQAWITGVTENNGEPEVWVLIRTEGRTMRLSIGEDFKIGDLEGKIAEVSGNRVVIDAGGEKITTRLGQPLVK